MEPYVIMHGHVCVPFLTHVCTCNQISCDCIQAHIQASEQHFRPLKAPARAFPRQANTPPASAAGDAALLAQHAEGRSLAAKCRRCARTRRPLTKDNDVDSPDSQRPKWHAEAAVVIEEPVSRGLFTSSIREGVGGGRGCEGRRSPSTVSCFFLSLVCCD